MQHDQVSYGQAAAASQAYTKEWLSFTNSSQNLIPVPSHEGGYNHESYSVMPVESMDLTTSSTPEQVSRGLSPFARSVSSLSSVTATPPPPSVDGTSDLKPPPAKRRKLTPSEREVNRLEKERVKQERERAQAEKKAKKEEEKVRKDEEKALKDEERRKKNEEKEVEKAIKDEERRKKNEEKDKKKTEKDMEKHQKEEIKRKKEEELAKKERAQMRIQSFFAKPASKGLASSPAASETGSPHRPISMPEDHTITPHKASGLFKHEATPKSESEPLADVSDYHRTFLPFAASTATQVAPINRFSLDEGAQEYLLRKAQDWFSDDFSFSPVPLAESLDLPFRDDNTSSGPLPKVKDIMDFMSGSSVNPVDITDDENSAQTAFKRLRRIPIKYLHFYEDIRPPYIGTSTSVNSTSQLTKLGRNPIQKQRPELDYDEDSEAEWEETEEGEDLNSDGESDAESNADTEEMDGFLDDEGAEDGPRSKKKHVINDMEPVVTGLCWEDAQSNLRITEQADSVNMKELRMEFISDSFKAPFDPFSIAAWQDEPPLTQTPNRLSLEASSSSSLRPPLQARPTSALNELMLRAPEEHNKKISKSSKDLGKILDGSELEDFKRSVDGSDLTKVGLLAVIKKRFPKTPNAVLSDTLKAVAERRGAKEADKRWVITT